MTLQYQYGRRGVTITSSSIRLQHLSFTNNSKTEKLTKNKSDVRDSVMPLMVQKQSIQLYLLEAVSVSLVLGSVCIGFPCSGLAGWTAAGSGQMWAGFSPMRGSRTDACGKQTNSRESSYHSREGDHAHDEEWKFLKQMEMVSVPRG